MSMDPPVERRFDGFVARIANILGHAARKEQLPAYAEGLMLPGDRKRVEPMAARVDPRHVPSRDPSMHHFVATSAWSDEAVLDRVRAEGVGALVSRGSAEACIVDDTGFPKKGKHPVGVAHPTSVVQGKKADCQVAVTLSLANLTAPVPAASRSYLPTAWADDPGRREGVAGPKDAVFMTKW